MKIMCIKFGTLIDMAIRWSPVALEITLLVKFTTATMYIKNFTSMHYDMLMTIRNSKSKSEVEFLYSS